MKTKKEEATLVQRASAKVTGFKALHKRLEKKIIVSGKSISTLNNYMRCIAHAALYFDCLPGQLDIEQIEEYLLWVKKKNTTASESFFKHTVYGLRFLFRTEGLDDRAIRLPQIKRDNRLPGKQVFKNTLLYLPFAIPTLHICSKMDLISSPSKSCSVMRTFRPPWCICT